MAVQAVLVAMTVDLRYVSRTLRLDLTGSYVTNGDALDLRASAITNPSSIDAGKAYSTDLPVSIEVTNAPGCFTPTIITNGVVALNGYKMKLYAPGGAEQAAGAYPAAVLSTTPPECPILIEMVHKRK